jgi:hypothetical protein
MLEISKPLVFLAFLFLVVCFLSGCGGPELWEDETFASRPTSVQVAIILRLPACVFATAFLLNGFPSFVKSVTTKTESETD